MTRRCRGAVYRIRVTNSLKHDGPQLKVNGETTKGTLVPYAPAGETVDIDCET